MNGRSYLAKMRVSAPLAGSIPIIWRKHCERMRARSCPPSAFGNLLRSTGSSPNEYRYNGELFDSTLGLDHLRARYLNPSTGRFVTADPAVPYTAYPPSLNRYVYGSSNPVNRSDPTGMSDPEGEAVEAALRPIYLREHGQDPSTVQFDDKSKSDRRLQNRYKVKITPDFVNFENRLTYNLGKTWEELKKASFYGTQDAILKNFKYHVALDQYGFTPEDWEPWDEPLDVNNEAYWVWSAGGGIIFWTKSEDLYNQRPSLAQIRAVSLALQTSAGLGLFGAAEAAIDAVVSTEEAVDSLGGGLSVAVGGL